MKRKKAPAVRPEPTREDAGEGPRLVRLNKYMADNGIASRRHADRLIEDGQVMVDGELAKELGQKIDPPRQRVEVNGVVLRPDGERHRYFLLSKPKNVICTNDEHEGKRRAIDLINDRKRGRIYTVGRLDEETTGLVILTNDGDFANRIGHPRYEVPKVYRVTLQGRISDEDVEKLRKGVRVAEFKACFEWIKVAKRSDKQSSLLLRLNEGRNREIRRVFAKLRLPVKSLHRIQIGPITDRGLKIGHWRPLVREEVEALFAASRGEGVAAPATPGLSGGRRGGARRGRGEETRHGARSGARHGNRSTAHSGASRPAGQARGAQRNGKSRPAEERGASVSSRPPGRRDRGRR